MDGPPFLKCDRGESGGDPLRPPTKVRTNCAHKTVFVGPLSPTQSSRHRVCPPPFKKMINIWNTKWEISLRENCS